MEASISMFYSHEVNKEAILFANGAYPTIHDAIVSYPPIIAANSLSSRIQLADAIKIICSTAEEDGKIVTKSSATCIKYKDFKTHKIRRSFSCQIHPELLSYLRGIGKIEAPFYSTLKIDDMVSAYLSNYCM
jgi:hypothetical protein